MPPCNGDCNQGRECICDCEGWEQPTNMVTVPLDVLEDMQRRLKTKEWQGLSDDEIWDIANFLGKNKEWDYPVMFAKTIDKALREKNG